MDTFVLLKELLQFVTALVSAVISGVAIHSWNTWRMEKKEEEKRLREIEDGHVVLKNDLTNHVNDVRDLKERHGRLEESVIRHVRKIVRLETLSQMHGQQLRVIDNPDDSRRVDG